MKGSLCAPTFCIRTGFAHRCAADETSDVRARFVCDFRGGSLLFVSFGSGNIFGQKYFKKRFIVVQATDEPEDVDIFFIILM